MIVLPKYSPENARRDLARRLYETSSNSSNWLSLPAHTRRKYERITETFFDARDKRFCDALAVLGFRHDNRA